jgi:hypothetical protein
MQPDYSKQQSVGWIMPPGRNLIPWPTPKLKVATSTLTRILFLQTELAALILTDRLVCESLPLLNKLREG